MGNWSVCPVEKSYGRENCEHDWVVNIYPPDQHRKCAQCGRVEVREVDED